MLMGQLDPYLPKVQKCCCSLVHANFAFSGTTPTTEHKQPPQHVDKEKLFDRQASQADVSRPFLQALAESRVQDNAVRTFLAYIDRYCRSHYLVTPIEFPPDHPVEEVNYCLFHAEMI